MQNIYSKQDKVPLVTVITVTYNVESSLQATIDSIKSQSYKNIEYIIIDGKSSDKTINIIKSNRSIISKWVSEKDNGIYDAMNKGIDLANGEWINFMNSGDTFVNNTTVEDFILEKRSNIDIYYGSRYIVYKDHKKLQKPFPIDEFYNRMPFGHQSAFIKTTVMKNYKYDLHYKIASDYDFFLKCYQNGARFYDLGFVICNFDINGRSSKQRLKTALETNNIIKDHLKISQLKDTYFYKILEKEICKSSSKHETISKLLKELSDISFYSHPIKKYKTYKRLMHEFSLK
jgi:glycosyltransferase involved in cell wall biosynthesis